MARLLARYGVKPKEASFTPYTKRFPILLHPTIESKFPDRIKGLQNWLLSA